MPPRTTYPCALALTALVVTACASTAAPAVGDAGADSAARPCSDDNQVPELLDVSVTASHGTVWFRFWYDDGNTWADWWALDNILVEGR